MEVSDGEELDKEEIQVRNPDLQKLAQRLLGKDTLSKLEALNIPRAAILRAIKIADELATMPSFKTNELDQRLNYLKDEADSFVNDQALFKLNYPDKPVVRTENFL